MSLANDALHYFGVKLPTGRSALKSAYRRAARQLHSDLGGSDAAFRAMQEVYDALQSPSATGVFTDGPKLLTTEEGTPLSELGLGLGPHKNGKECVTCKGDGYSKRRGVRWTPKEPCYICRSLGSTLGCRTCYHSDFKKHNEEVYAICAPCKGTGEIEIFNPVIPKGFLMSGHLGQKARKRAEQEARNKS